MTTGGQAGRPGPAPHRLDVMPKEVTYREARAGDLAAVSRLVLAICERELFPQFESAGQETLREIYGLESLRTQLDAGGAFVLAEAGGQPVGAVALRPPAHVFLLYVDTGYRRLGLGASLMERLIALRPEAQQITLNANLAAVAFYEAIGFRADGRERSDKGLQFLPMVLERGLIRDGSGP